jgi:uncharacterized protein YbcV (DUF1398 family)
MRNLQSPKLVVETVLLKHLNLHSQGKTSYLEMSQGLAENWIEKWTFDTNEMTMTYCSIDGIEMLTEAIK